MAIALGKFDWGFGIGCAEVHTYLGETGRPLPSLLAREPAQTIVFRFCRARRRMVVESYNRITVTNEPADQVR